MDKLRIVTSVDYLPGDNITLIESSNVSKDKNVTASFMIPIINNNSIVFANNQKRGLEFSGGHTEPGETPEKTSKRETYEETGSVVSSVCPSFYITHLCYFEKPENYNYPFPVSHMQFFTGKVDRLDKFEENSECKSPIIISFVNKKPILNNVQRALWNHFINKNKYNSKIIEYIIKDFE